MIDFSYIYPSFKDTKLENWLETLEPQINDKSVNHNNGNVKKWALAMDRLCEATDTNILMDQSWVELTGKLKEPESFAKELESFMPWRKGPFTLFDNKIDTEWRSDFKWDRIVDHISDLKHRNVLDVGCGNGYHCWRMLAQGAQNVVGIDPSWLSVFQFHLINKYAQQKNITVLPFTLEEMTPNLQAFDTVFSMGVLYHRRSPLDHLSDLKDCLSEDGELVLETMVIEGKLGEVLVPEGRYAQMNNIWFLPSVDTLISWCHKMGFEDAKCIDLSTTTTDEQRTTAWKPGQSLQDYLDPNDPSKTIEGHPAPLRATIVAKKSNKRLSRYS